MSRFEDNDLIAALQSGIAQRQSGVSLPDGLGEDARRAARRRTTARAAAVGVSVLASAGVATVLATGAGGGSKGAAALPRSGVGAPGTPLTGQESAYVITRLKASVAADRQSGTVIDSYQLRTGHVSAGGSLVGTGWRLSNGYQYLPPDGGYYSNRTLYEVNGSVYLRQIDDYVHNAGGGYTYTGTLVNPSNQRYTRTVQTMSDGPSEGTLPNLTSSPSVVQHALSDGRLTDPRAALVNGARAVVFSVTLPRADASGYAITLYVDARSYRPVRTVMTATGLPGAIVDDWLPSTPANIARAKDDTIPVGDTRVSGLSALIPHSGHAGDTGSSGASGAAGNSGVAGNSGATGDSGNS